MSMSIEELDATVRAFYEGRGDTVRFFPVPGYILLTDIILRNSKNKLKLL